MKIWLITILMLLSVNLMANTKNFQKPLDENINEKQPIAFIRVFDTSNKYPKLMRGNKLSRRKSRQMCVFIANVPILEQNLFSEHLKAPRPMNINFKGENVKIGENKKNVLITFNVSKEQISNNLISQCWTFTKKDPIGTYKLDVQFNNIVFKGLEFKVLK